MGAGDDNMENIKKNIAVENSINIKYYKERNVTVKDKDMIGYVSIAISFILSIIFIIGSINYKNDKTILIIFIVLGIIFFIFSIIMILYCIIFELKYEDDYLYYKNIFKKEKISINNIKSFKANTDNMSRYYYVEINYNPDKKIRYQISVTNKENFILLLNLLKKDITQIY